MNDKMTAEQALEWLRTIAAISGAVASDRPLSFSYQEAVKFQAAVKALTAPRVPEGWRVSVSKYGIEVAGPDRQITEISSSPVYMGGNDPVVYGFFNALLTTAPSQPVAPRVPDVDALAQIIREVDGDHSLGAGALAEAIIEKITAAPAPAEPMCKHCGNPTMHVGDVCYSCCQAPADELNAALTRYVRDEVRWPGDNTPRKSQAELARLRARVKELEDVIDTIRTSLHKANEEGAISDTLWASDCETLFDYIEAARLRGGSDE
jgi:hypothetical protein